MRNALRLALLCPLCLTLFISLTGCPKKAVNVELLLDATASVNPDPQGQPLSVVVRIYQLKDKGRLEKADYTAILKSDKSTLADDLLDTRERVLEPGKTETVPLQPDPAARYLGVVALFRAPVGDSWRRIVPIRGKDEKISLSLQGQTIEVTSVSK